MVVTSHPTETPLTAGSTSVPPTVPTATYRVQLSETFTFQNAAAVVPYLAGLGVSHLYVSPILAASSAHGYDVTNQQMLNPALGTEADLEALVLVLRQHGMGLIVDIVPNHMGVGTQNAWWQAVLADGPYARYAHYFDIYWQPLKPELAGKVLLPVLGQSYGETLQSEALSLRFSGQNTFEFHYYEHCFPLSMASWVPLLNDALRQMGADDPLYTPLQTMAEEAQAIVHERQQRGLAALTAVVSLSDSTQSVALRHRLSALSQVSPTLAETMQAAADRLFNTATAETKHSLLEMQYYRLAFWRVASDEINYRRFFNINELIGLRVEAQDVFEATHSYLLSLMARGWVDGFRVDHPDGLADPKGYLHRLNAACRSVRPTHPPYLLIEKILAPDETLPEDWPVAGTTGYEALTEINRVLVNPAGEKPLTRQYQRMIGEPVDVAELKRGCKRQVMQTLLASELNTLAAQLNRISEMDWRYRDYSVNSLRQALMDVVVHLEVYRTYFTPTEQPERCRRVLNHAIKEARKASKATDLSIFDFIRQCWSLALTDDEASALYGAMMLFSRRVQQFTGPVMAKSMEDTFFYRYTRLTSLNEVGGEPDAYGLPLATFHRQQQARQQVFSGNMVALSTHDTKRSEDVRARIHVLSDTPDHWQAVVKQCRTLTKKYRTPLEEDSSERLTHAPSPQDEWLFYQTLAGTWHTDSISFENYTERIQQYLLKCAKEAKLHTSWANPNVAYEQALQQFVAHSLGNAAFCQLFDELTTWLAPLGELNSLSQTVLKLTLPGVADCYQGTEALEFSLVDPDNRRPVAFEQFGTSVSPVPFSKSALVHALTQFRRQHGALFTSGEYHPLTVVGPMARHVIGYQRVLDNQRLCVLATRWHASLVEFEALPRSVWPVPDNLWQETELETPLQGQWLNLLTGQTESTLLSLSQRLTQQPVWVGFQSHG